MKELAIYEDIAKRTQGDIYIGANRIIGLIFLQYFTFKLTCIMEKIMHYIDKYINIEYNDNKNKQK